MEQQKLRTVLGDAPQDAACAGNKQAGDPLGTLPPCAPLANPYVPFQNEDPARYPIQKGLIRGTLFPGLDLPYLGMVNDEEKGDRGLAELQALAFAIQELGLYLDTHGGDAEAAALFASYSKLYRQGVKVYQETRGPLTQLCAVPKDRYLWTEGPWPWEYDANRNEEA